ncbi:phosphatidate cytidylyltransferase, partial [Salmonella enterica subsp. enterica]|nr:phosphatidate cytidylyltransferase [Salmonella enterica subsp. enterica]
GAAMFATREPILMLPLLLVGAGFGAFEWSKLMPSLEQNPDSYVPPTTQIPTKPAKPIDYSYTLVVLGIVSLLLVMAKLTGSIASWVFFWLVAALIWLVAIGWIRRYPNNTQAWYGKHLYVIGMIILSSAITAMYYLWSLSAWWLLYVFVLVWCADSGAYFVGRKIGRRKMSPHVSPNKSVEGLLGGLATGTLVVIGVSFGLLNDWSMTAIGVFLLLSLLTIIMSVFGDLFESMLKRHAGVKDAGA